VFERVGLFSLDYPHVADRDFLSRALMAGIRTAPVEALVYRYRRHGESLTFATGAEQGEVLRAELLRLAQAVLAHPEAPASLRYKARTLAGRCLSTLLKARLKAHDPAGALRLLAMQDSRLSAAPVAALAAGLADTVSVRRG
jgi:hypothetical protein